MNYYPYNQVPYQQTYPAYPSVNRFINLQGKVVDNAEVVKAIDIPLDGSISYFPLADGTAIVSKQLQSDGTSRVIVYKPMNTQEPKYVTENDLKDIRDELESLKKKVLNNESI